MATHTLVREAREGRQYEGEIIHCASKGSEKTVCGKYSQDEIRTVKNISVFVDGGNMCQECSNVMSDMLF